MGKWTICCTIIIRSDFRQKAAYTRTYGSVWQKLATACHTWTDSYHGLVNGQSAHKRQKNIALIERWGNSHSSLQGEFLGITKPVYVGWNRRHRIITSKYYPRLKPASSRKRPKCNGLWILQSDGLAYLTVSIESVVLRLGRKLHYIKTKKFQTVVHLNIFRHVLL